MFSGGAAYIMKHDTFSDSFAMHLLLPFAENYILATDVQWHTSNITQKQKYVNSVCYCEGVSHFSKTCQYATAIFSLSYWDVSIIVLFIMQVHLEFPTVWSGVLWQRSSERATYCIFPPPVIEPSGFSCPLARPAFSHLWLFIWWTLIASLQTCLLWLGPDYDVMCARLCGDPWPIGILGKLA